ncbi:MAG TPA: MBL fold metallo-hydrolase [Fastidiosipila sp.]|nr:MBL fold metallo-hydrolase [Fastidiosipila sp.]
MIFETIESKGLAHFSYLVGSEGEAFVIDPRRDVQIYLDLAMEHGLKITHIFETHRNEDYVVGSMELSALTGATIHISGHEDLGYVYGEKISDGEVFQIGELSLKALHTPGHTLGHLCYALYEKDQEAPYLVFTGDTLFMGDLGRTDFYGEENLDKMTGLLYDSVVNKLLPLGDHVLLFPAHGAGSACGESMDDRPFSTLGYERLTNEHLQAASKEAFIESFARMRIKPRYFERMEELNVKGAPFIGDTASVPAIKADDLKDDQVLLDVRSKEAFMGGHIEGSYFLSPANLSTFLGTLFDEKTRFVLVTDEPDPAFLLEIRSQMLRIGFDCLDGYLEGGVNSLLEAEKSPLSLPTIRGEALRELAGEFLVLDIRDNEPVPDWLEAKTVRIPLQMLYKRYAELDPERDIYVLCASGNRSTTAASFLLNHGYRPAVILGGIHTI